MGPPLEYGIAGSKCAAKRDDLITSRSSESPKSGLWLDSGIVHRDTTKERRKVKWYLLVKINIYSYRR